MKNKLSAEGLLVKIRSVGLPQTGDNGPVEVLVPESEVDEAMEIINSI
ncbi:MAG: glutamate decarboxylase [Peptococcaceae bacterium BRH_c4b]|nr:MAG: glutamate decarboxylase [Peptococcaceae bacterium BRH_c4b]